MKKFFTAVFATMVGILFLWILVFFTFLFIGVTSLSSSQAPIKTNSVLTLDLNGVIKERVIDNPFENLYGNSAPKYIGLNDILRAIKQAETDNNIKGISLYANQISTNYATLEEIRSALVSFRKTGKFIYCYSENMSQQVYYLSTVADRIFLHPQGSITLKGLAAETLFFKQLLKKLEIEAQIIRHGEFKSAVEPFILDKMSKANKEQLSCYLNSTWDKICKDISKSRNIKYKRINEIADSLLLLYDLQTAVKEHFIDSIAYRDTYDSFIKHKLQIEQSRDYNKISLQDYKNSLQKAKTTPHRIALIYATGDIIDDEGNNDQIGFNIAEEIKNARQDKSIKAIVLRINSGGGSALMSDIIWREVAITKKEKPVIVSMGDYAASGGYYIACAANYIVAQPTTLTGSIGVFGIIPNIENFLSNKLGITTDQVKTNKNADAISITRSMSVYEQKILQKTIEKTYNTFIQHVAEGRNLSIETVDSIAQGRIWNGVNAYQIGLADTLGGLDLAIRIAAEKAKLKNYSIIERPVMKNLLEQLTTSFMETTLTRQKAKLQNNHLYQYYSYWEQISQLKGIQARLPFIITIE